MYYIFFEERFSPRDDLFLEVLLDDPLEIFKLIIELVVH